MTTLVCALGVSCDVPADRLFEPPVVEPVEVRPGLLRLSFNPGPDLVRGFDPTGERVIYRSRGLPGLGDEWRMLAVPVAGGAVEEVAGLYRAALLNPPGAVDVQQRRRVYTVWRTATEGAEACRACPSPAVVALTIIRLDSMDGRALSGLPTRNVALTTFEPSPDPAFRRVRLTPADLEIVSRGTNPYGPTVPPVSDTGYYSDGEILWRFDLERPSIPADPIGPGAFPAVSSDGRFVAAAVPIVADSVTAFCGAQACTQETVEFALIGWTIRLYDPMSGTARDLGPGLEPRFHPTEPKLLVRRIGGLYWVDPESAAADSIPGTGGAFAATIAPDGSRLAFSMNLFGNPDVFILRLDQ